MPSFYSPFLSTSLSFTSQIGLVKGLPILSFQRPVFAYEFLLLPFSVSYFMDFYFLLSPSFFFRFDFNSSFSKLEAQVVGSRLFFFCNNVFEAVNYPLSNILAAFHGFSYGLLLLLNLSYIIISIPFPSQTRGLFRNVLISIRGPY